MNPEQEFWPQQAPLMPEAPRAFDIGEVLNPTAPAPLEETSGWKENIFKSTNLIVNVRDNEMSKEDALSLYPELSQDYIDDLYANIKDWADADQLIVAYPELTTKQEESPLPDLVTKNEVQEINKPSDDSFVNPIIWVTWDLIKSSPNLLESFWEWIDNLIWGAIASTPEIVWNTAWAVTDLIWGGLGLMWFPKGDELLKSLWTQFKEDWIKDKESIQRFLDVNDESKMAKIWEVWANIAAIMTPTPAWKGKVVLSVKELALKWKTLLEGIKAGKTTATLLQLWTRWAVLWAKAEAITEWELTAEWITEWAVLEVGFAWVGKLAKTIVPKKTIDWMREKIKERLSGLIKIPTGKTSATAITKEIDGWADAIAIIKQRNPTFKIEDSKNALKETLEEVWTSKEAIFKEYDSILRSNNVNVWRKELTEEVLKIADNVDFQTLSRNTAKVNWTETAAFDILERKLKGADLDRSVLELYDDTKLLQKNLKWLFNQTSSKDALESVVDLHVLKAYNNIIWKKIWELKWTEFTKLKSEYGALKGFEESIGRKYKTLLNKSSSGLHNYADAFLDSELVTSALRLDAVGFGKAGLTKLFRNEFTKLGDPNQILSKVFKWFDDIAELEANPLKAQLKEKFKQFSKDVIKTATVKEFIDNE